VNLWILIPLALVIAVVVASAVGTAIATEDDIEIEYKRREELLLLRLYALTNDPCESVRVIHPPYDWAEEVD